MKHFVLALALACALSGTALAGDVHSTDSSAQKPPVPIVTAPLPAPQPPIPFVKMILAIIDLVVR